MIAVGTDSPSSSTDWQTGFLALLPQIEQRLQQAFRHRDPASRDDAIADGVVICLLSFKRLHERDRARSVSGSNLAWYAAKQVRNGRGAECRLNSKNPLCRYARLRRGIHIEQLQEGSLQDREWVDAIVQDRRSSVLDQVAARIDITAWLATLCRRTRQIAADLGQGGTTSDVARKYDLTAGRISQLRRELAESWREFQHEPALGTY